MPNFHELLPRGHEPRGDRHVVREGQANLPELMAAMLKLREEYPRWGKDEAHNPCQII